MGMDTRSPSQDRFLKILERCANHPDVQTEVIKNHDNNLWWPNKVEDWRLRLVVAGWSTRISYNMITTYQDVVDAANKLGYERLADSTNDELKKLARPLGLFKARLGYFRSLQRFIVKLQAAKVNPKEIPNDDLVEKIAREVRGAGYKVAQCAALYAKGYHCGIIPIDSGMKDMLGPCLGFHLPRGPRGHEVMRKQIEALAHSQPSAYQALAHRAGYTELDLPDNRAPSWWIHLVLVYYKRLHCNKRKPQRCFLRQDKALGQYIGTMCSPTAPTLGRSAAPLSK